jgi:hypothetical protein
VPENVKGKTQADPVAGPDTVRQVLDGEAVVVVGVVVVELVVLVVVVVAGYPQTLFVQTGALSDPHTQVLQFTV